MNQSPTTEERIWAALAHLSALAFGWGLILPIVSWSEQRGKSRYAAFQALQALGYQSLGYTIWLLLTLVIVIFDTILLLANLEQAFQDESAITGWAIAHAILLFSLFGVYLVLPIAAGISCALGREFRYPLMGHRLARYLGYEGEVEGLHEDHENRWVAAMSHLTVIIALWGMLAPLTAWVLQGRRSLWLKFQSIQALLFQAFVMSLTFVAGAVYVSGLAAFAILSGFGENAAFDPSRIMAGFIVFLVSMLIAAAILLVLPLFHILGQWAGYRVLRGDDYRYPAIGTFVERRIAHHKDTESRSSN
jgi:uncharacterized Tic20 family protein